VGSPTYDGRGNTTSLTGQTMAYDGSDRHVATTAGATTVRYTRDATDRIVERKVNGTTVAKYGFSGEGDAADFVLDASGSTVVERTISLPGGVLLTKRGSGDIWSYPNLHGDVMATANSAGAKQGSTITYDPYGVGLTAPPDNSVGNLDYGWLGAHQRGLEHEGVLATIEMGARQYLPQLGRFLEVDPVDGGSANDYEYAGGDSCNSADVDGDAFLHIAIPILVGGIILLEAAKKKAKKPSKSSFRDRVIAGRSKNCQAHHIVAKGSKNKDAARARALLEQADIDVNDTRNGVALNKTGHATLHTNVYYRRIADQLQAAWDRKGAEGVRNTLAALKGAFGRDPSYRC
jgi:RHS repeat-associated protein